MSSSTRRPARRTLPTRTAKKISMSRQYTSSFSGIDWGGMLSGSLLKPRGSDFSVGLDEIDLPSMSSGGEGSSAKQSKKKKSENGSGNNVDGDDEGKSNARGSVLLVEQILQENEQEGKRNKPLWQELKDLYSPTKSKQKVQFDMNGENVCEEVVMEDGQKISVAKCGGCDKSRGCKWCLVALTTLAIVAVVAATVYFIMFPPNTASLYWKKAMSGMRDDWKSSSSNNNNVVVQQQLLLQQQQQQQGRGQEMLELAEQITLACGESSLLRSGSSFSSSASAGGGGGVDARSGMSSCQELCHNHMCCVEQDDEYSCKNDVTKDCGVYAGCMTLIDDNFW
mmetsp:Transcript_26945/g.40066  ORF Transcript_26945/g.40066 Transcript_26945/m.40066 type:complete len:338 (+) Transcript_26945:130-1143(+)